MKKTLTIFAMLLLCGVGYAQEEQKKGGTLEELAAIMQQNNDVMIRNAEIVKSIPQLITDQYQKQTGTIIVGTTIGVLLLYLFILFFDRVKRIRQKKDHEDYIQELEGKEKALMTQIKSNETRLENILTRLEEKLPQPQQNTPNMDKREIAMGMGTIMVGLGVLGLISKASYDIQIYDIRLMYVLIQIMQFTAITIGIRLWLISQKYKEVKIE